jgi:hypothetical protein
MSEGHLLTQKQIRPGLRPAASFLCPPSPQLIFSHSHVIISVSLGVHHPALRLDHKLRQNVTSTLAYATVGLVQYRKGETVLPLPSVVVRLLLHKCYSLHLPRFYVPPLRARSHNPRFFLTLQPHRSLLPSEKDKQK